MGFREKLQAAVAAHGSYLCVGLDPDPALMPKVSLASFLRAIVEATADLVCAYKPNLAFFEALGPRGLAALIALREMVAAPVPLIADGKRGDVGHSMAAYSRALFDVLAFDGATVSPYLGRDALAPFLERQDKGVFVLCRTSNPGGADLQELPVQWEGSSRPLYEAVALLARRWNERGNVGLVVGATYPQELARVRQLCPDMTLLLPGVGPQGGEVAATVAAAVDGEGGGFIINASRQVLYASRGRDFARAARRAALELREEVNRCRERAMAAGAPGSQQPIPRSR